MGLSDSALSKIFDESGKRGLLEDYGREDFIDDLIYKLQEDAESHIDDRSGIEAILRRYIGSGLFDVGSIKKVNLSIKNPKIIDASGEEYTDGFITSAIENAKRNGFDGVIFKGLNDAATLDDKGNGSVRSDVFVAFKEGQIREANHVTAAPDIR